MTPGAHMMIWSRLSGGCVRQRGGIVAEFPALPLWTDAYLADTQHLTNEEHGVYLRLLMFAWRTSDCSLPVDDRRLATMVGVTAKVWARLKPVVMSFWTLDGDVWRQKKLTSERVFVKAKRDAGRAGAEARWNGKPLSNNETDNANPYSKPHSKPYGKPMPPTPIPSKKEREPIGSPKKSGSRLQADWALPPDWLAWSTDQGLPELAGRLEGERFRDYWIGIPGPGGVKLDWQATWRNWVRKAIADQAKYAAARKPTHDEYRDEPTNGAEKIGPTGINLKYSGWQHKWVRAEEWKS